MQIELPPDADALVYTNAEAAGFGKDIAAYVGHLIVTDKPTENAFGPSSAEELATSEAMIRRGEEELAAGKYRDMKEALLELGTKRGYSIQG
ncbi:hypothetical protein [Bythopirellula goksoeyrii]|nr:hypothetical protein [Bythopirellula goksoeyrii]